MDIEISGSGRISAGEYENIRVCGSAKLVAPIRCHSYHCSGSSRVTGKLDAQDEICISGSTQFDGDTAAQYIRISGSAAIYGNCSPAAELHASGSLRCFGTIEGNTVLASGALYAENAKAERVQVHGKLTCPGHLHAEKIEIKMSGSTSKVGNISGGSIRIFPERYHKIISRIPLLPKLLRHRGYGDLTVMDAIEGDEISLEMVTAARVSGRDVTIGAGCHIDLVQYRERIEISPHAKVERQEQII